MFIFLVVAKKLSRKMTVKTAITEKPKSPALMTTTVSCPLEGAQAKK